MKKIITASIAAVFCVAAVGCSTASEKPDSVSSVSSAAESLSPAEKSEKLLKTVEFPSMVEVIPDKLEFYYGITTDDVTEFSAYICGSGMAPDEFGIFEAKDQASAEKIKAALKARIDEQYETFESYTPDAMYRFDDSFAEINGTTVIYAVCSDNSAAKEILK